MLVSTIIGNSDAVGNNWELIKDSYGSTFIGNNDIRQRIRLGKNVNEKIEKVFSAANMAGYEIASNVVFSNSNKNMNISLINFWCKNEEEKNNHEDSNIAYITLISDNFKLISYELAEGATIIQTYRRKDAFQGCAIIFDSTGIDLVTLKAKDLKANRFVNIVVSIDSDCHPIVTKDEITNSKELNNIKNTFKKLAKRMIHFKMSCPMGLLPTSTFIVNGTSDELVKDVQELTGSIKNASILTLPAGDTSFTDVTDEEKDAIDRMFQEHLIDERIRAVTTVGIKLPMEFCKRYKILYLYDLNPETGVVTCIKSN